MDSDMPSCRQWLRHVGGTNPSDSTLYPFDSTLPLLHCYPNYTIRGVTPYGYPKSRQANKTLHGVTRSSGKHLILPPIHTKMTIGKYTARCSDSKSSRSGSEELNEGQSSVDDCSTSEVNSAATNRRSSLECNDPLNTRTFQVQIIDSQQFRNMLSMRKSHLSDAHMRAMKMLLEVPQSSDIPGFPNLSTMDEEQENSCNRKSKRKTQLNKKNITGKK